MSRHRRGAACRLLLIAASAVLVVACTSTTDRGNEGPDSPPPQPTDFRAWEESTRSRVDDLMADAHRLMAAGDIERALAKTDEALCEIFETPPGYRATPVYLDFVAELIDEAEVIEASWQPFEDDMVGDPEDLVILPPLDVVETGEAVEDAIEEDGIPHSDLPLVINPTVEGFLSAMSSEGEYQRRISLGLQRSGTYLPMIRDRLESAGLPHDLSYLPLIESAFSVKAYSRARAHGMWQFISSTARHYGLEVGPLLDERRDPVRSTEAAVAYLGDLYGEFGDWYLALAAYNSGAGNVRRAIRRSGSTDFWVLRRYLPRETRNYVPAFIASVIVAKRPAAFGFPTVAEQPWQYDSLDVPDALDLQFLADKSGISIDLLRELNPAIRRDLTPARMTTRLRLPAGTSGTVAAVLENSPRSEWAPRMIHTVRSGDSLYTIARRYGSSVDEIRQANGLRGSLIHPGQSLIVPRYASNAGRSSPSRTFSSESDGTYVVQRNDTLWDIARGFGVSVDALCHSNGLARSSVIRPGQRIRIPDTDSASRTSQPAVNVVAHGASPYVVRSGDTLYDIARLHGVSVSSLKRANNLRTSRIHPGDVLQIPHQAAAGSVTQAADGEVTYRVRHGDTLYDIARRHGVSVSQIQRANNLRGSRIHPGDLLRIPTSQAKG